MLLLSQRIEIVPVIVAIANPVVSTVSHNFTLISLRHRDCISNAIPLRGTARIINYSGLYLLTIPLNSLLIAVRPLAFDEFNRRSIC